MYESRLTAGRMGRQYAPAMSSGESSDLDLKSPPFDQFTHIQKLSNERSGHASGGHARHHLYIGRDRRTRAQMLIKLTAKPGLVYERNLANEIASLTTINRELTESRYFPLLGEHGRLRDGRIYLTISLFSEFPLATTIGPERLPERLVGHLRTALEVARALMEIHALGIYHVDLNPMNILYRSEKGRPVIRIVDFESSFEAARHAGGASYNPPTTAGFSAPEVAERAPDGRADLFSLGAVLYTLLAGYEWTWSSDVTASVAEDRALDGELREILLKAVAAKREKRYAGVAEFSRAAGAYLEKLWPGRSW